MLGITANWGLADGSLGGTSPAVADRWLDALRLAVIRAGSRRDGRYRPVEQVTFVFAGDTLDLLLTERWAGRTRPWHPGRRGRLARLEVLAATLRAARGPIARLRRWARHGLAVPAADARGRPTDRIFTRAAVEPVILLGDRDADLEHLASETTRLGVRIGGAWSDGRHAIRHGHDLDPLRFVGDAGGRRPADAIQPTLAASLTIDLLVPFAIGVRSVPAAWRSLRPVLGRLAASGPLAMAEILSTLLARLAPAQRAAVADHWQKSVDGWFAAARREPPVHELEFDAPAALAAWLGSVTRCAALAEHVPAAIRRLEAHPPRGGLDAIDVLGHLVCPTAAGTIGLGGDAPRLLVRPWAGASLELGWLDSGPQDSGVVKVGQATAGSGIVDAA